MRSTAAITVLSTALLLLSSTPGRAFHLQVVRCGQYCDTACPFGDTDCVDPANGRCKLGANLICGPLETAVTLNDGIDLDMNGRDITCTAVAPDTCGPAITMTASNSQILNDSSQERKIAGRFATAVDCAHYSGSQVKNVTLEGALRAIFGCSVVSGSVLRGFGAGSEGIVTSIVSNGSDKITGNYFERLETIVSVEGPNTGLKRLEISSNHFHTGESETAVFILAYSNKAAELTDNSFLGIGASASAKLVDAQAPLVSGSANNICDKDHPDCLNCTTAPYSYQGPTCRPLRSPF